jgi:hypothetical protein
MMTVAIITEELVLVDRDGSAVDGDGPRGDLPARGRAGARPRVGGGAMTKTLSAIRTAVVTHSTQPPAGSTTICTDELGPVIPRTFAPAPGWSSKSDGGDFHQSRQSEQSQ